MVAVVAAITVTVGVIVISSRARCSPIHIKGAISIKILILGGTVFLGRHICEQALIADHEVTLFNRGITNPDLFKGDVEYIRGNRSSDLGKLNNRHWDICIDPSGMIPGDVDGSSRFLSDQTEHYTYISSISVYQDYRVNGITEEYALQQLGTDQSTTEMNNENYGALKVMCERSAEENMPGRVLHVRSGLIVGPYDPTNRFTYWPARVHAGGEILAPVTPLQSVQFIDARDQAIWILSMAERRQAGTYNLTGPADSTTLGDLLEDCVQAIESDVKFKWAPADVLARHKVHPWMGLPLWLPDAMSGMNAVSIDAALRQGVITRATQDTVLDTLEWYRSQPSDKNWPAGISRELEAQVLEHLRE